MVKFFSPSVESSYDRLFGALDTILTNQRKIMGDLTVLNSNIAALQAAVASNTSAAASVVALVGTMKVAPDQAALDAAAANVASATTQVETNNAALTGALPVAAPPVTPPST